MLARSAGLLRRRRISLWRRPCHNFPKESYMIENYSFGRITINGKTYTSDIIIFPDRIQSSWWRESGHSLSLKDIEAVLALKPEILVIGTGSGGLMRVPNETRNAIKRRGIETCIQKTDEACQTYNRLIGKKAVIGALHLTC